VSEYKTSFGFPDFAPNATAAYGPALTIGDLHLANEMYAAIPTSKSLEQTVIYLLVQMTQTAWIELLTLAGHGLGVGAMKISRGMFESSLMAQYLLETPEEFEDYFGCSYVINFKR
jgi:hypothetical protein